MTTQQLLLYSPPAFGIVRLTGPDAERYLHGRITQEVKKLPNGSAARSLVLTPQGRILGQFSLFRAGSDLFYAASDPLENQEQAADFLHALLQFKVADRLEGRECGSEFRRHFAIGTGALKFAADLAAGLEVLPFGRSFGPIKAAEFLLPAAADPRSSLQHNGGREIGTNEFNQLTISAGLPLFGRELSERTLAPEIELDSLVSFNKGCYAGQEVVEMAAARGRANRRLCRLSAPGDHPQQPGTMLFRTAETDTPEGAVCSSAYDPQASCTFILAFLKSAEGLAERYFAGAIQFSRLQ